MKKKEIYLPPAIEVTEVELEQGVAAGSVEPGSEGNETTPEIDDWEDGGNLGDDDDGFFDGF